MSAPLPPPDPSILAGIWGAAVSAAPLVLALAAVGSAVGIWVFGARMARTNDARSEDAKADRNAREKIAEKDRKQRADDAKADRDERREIADRAAKEAAAERDQRAADRQQMGEFLKAFLLQGREGVAAVKGIETAIDNVNNTVIEAADRFLDAAAKGSETDAEFKARQARLMLPRRAQPGPRP